MKKLILLLIIVITISGCGGTPTPGTETQVSNGKGSADIKLVKLSDGTKCAILIGHNKGSITCDWK